MSSIFLICERLQTILKRQGISLYDLFIEYDRGKSGTIAINKFQQILASIHCWYTPEEFKELLDRFSDGNLLNYADLSNYIQSNSFFKHSEISPSILIEFGSYLSSRGITLNDFFIEYDRTHSGRVPLQLFFKCVGNTSISQEIAKAYSSPKGDISYTEIQQDILNAIQSRNAETSSLINNQLPPIFSTFSKCVISNRINLMDDFLLADHFKRGFLPKTTFLSILSSAHLPFSPIQLEDISYSFTQDNFVNYNLFHQNVLLYGEKEKKENPKMQKTVPTKKPETNIDIDQLIAS